MQNVSVNVNNVNNVTNNVVSGDVRQRGDGLSDICWEFNEMKGCKKGSACKWRHAYVKGKIEHPYTGKILDGDKAREYRLKQETEIVSKITELSIEPKIEEANSANEVQSKEKEIVSMIEESEPKDAELKDAKVKDTQVMEPTESEPVQQ